LGSACIVLGEIGKGEEVLRLGVQYAGDGPAASDIYFRLGSAMLGDGRAGEAIGPLRRAANLGAPGDKVWPLLAQALAARGRFIAAYSATLEARAAGASPEAVLQVTDQVREVLGPALLKFQELTERRP
jgi:Flp pilus assembly protein TadD